MPWHQFAEVKIRYFGHLAQVVSNLQKLSSSIRPMPEPVALTHQFALTASGRMSSWARWLGFSGLIPQISLAAIAIGGPASAGPAASGLALSYAALILSFNGGTWWGLVSRSHAPVRGSVWLAAIAPSLIAFAAISAWAIGGSPELSLFVIGAALIGALGFDYRLEANGLCPRGWLRLRTPLSLWLGGITLLIAIVP